MSLMRSRMQEVALRKRKKVLRDDQSGYEAEGALIQASIQPMSGIMMAQMYGERMNEMRLLLTSPEAEIISGMGVCVEVPPDAHPDYRIVYAARWSKHTVAHIQLIPEAERGDT